MLENAVFPNLHVPSFFQKLHTPVCFNSHLSPFRQSPLRKYGRTFNFEVDGDRSRSPLPRPFLPPFGDLERLPLPRLSLSCENEHVSPLEHDPFENQLLQMPLGHDCDRGRSPASTPVLTIARPRRKRLF